MTDDHVVSSGRLDERVLTALHDLSGRVAFGGLRRVLHAHPESLSRALHRLEREGRVEHVDGGYRALDTDAGDVAAPPDPARLRPVAQVELPPGAAAAELTGQLAGRWFGTLRWVGHIERPEGRLLAWARRDGAGLVLLGLRGRQLSVYVPSPRGSPEAADGDAPAYDLLAHAAEILRAPAGGAGRPLESPIRTFELRPPPTTVAG